MNYSDLPEVARSEAARVRTSTVQALAASPEEFDHWSRMLETDAFLLEAVRHRLARWAQQGNGKAERIIGSTLGAMLAYGVEPDRALMAIQFVLHGSQGPVNP